MSAVEALRFYAAIEHYVTGPEPGDESNIEEDSGKLARAALAALPMAATDGDVVLEAAVVRAEGLASDLAREKRSASFLRRRFDELADEFGLAPEDHAGIARAARGREGSHGALRKIAALLTLPEGNREAHHAPINPDQVVEAARQRLATPSWLTDLWHAIDGVTDATGGTIHQALRAVKEIRESHRNMAQRAAEADAALQGLAKRIGDDDLPTHEAIAAAVCSRFERGEEAEDALAKIWALTGETEVPAFYSDVVDKVARLEERHAAVVSVLADAQGLILRLAMAIGVQDGEDVETALARVLEAKTTAASFGGVLMLGGGGGPGAIAGGVGGNGRAVMLGGRGGGPGEDGEDGQGIGGGVGGKGGRSGGR